MKPCLWTLFLLAAYMANVRCGEDWNTRAEEMYAQYGFYPFAPVPAFFPANGAPSEIIYRFRGSDMDWRLDYDGVLTGLRLEVRQVFVFQEKGETTKRLAVKLEVKNITDRPFTYHDFLAIRKAYSRSYGPVRGNTWERKFIFAGKILLQAMDGKFQEWVEEKIFRCYLMAKLIRRLGYPARLERAG